MYTAKNIETGEVTKMTQEEVQNEIARCFQHDFGVRAEYDLEGEALDTAIANDVRDSMYAYFETGTYETDKYEITKDAQ